MTTYAEKMTQQLSSLGIEGVLDSFLNEQQQSEHQQKQTHGLVWSPVLPHGAASVLFDKMSEPNYIKMRIQIMVGCCDMMIDRCCGNVGKVSR
jgi:hypothetical protein